MDFLSLDEIIYITRFLSLKNTFNFIKSLNYVFTNTEEKSMLVKNKKLVVIENVYNSYFEQKGSTNHSFEELKEIGVLLSTKLKSKI
jgi:hypothetical protein